MPSPLTKAITRKPLRPNATVSARLQLAIRAVIHEGLELNLAAEKAGISTFHLRQSFEKRHVLAFIREEKQVRLESIRLETLNDLARIKAGDGAAAVSAIKLLEEMAGGIGAQSTATVAANTPGVTINIVNAIPSESGHAIEGQHVQGVTIDADRAIEASGDHPTTGEKSS